MEPHTTSFKHSEEPTCQYCLQKLSSMEEPKELPCGHVFCLPCLQDDFTNNNSSLKCITCGQTPTVRNLEDLPGATLPTAAETEEKEEEEVLIITCDKCEGENSCLSICYCVDCKKQLCRRHLKLHDKSLKSLDQAHATVDIKEYREAPAKTQPEFCPDHENERVVLACDLCHQTFCLQCETDEICDIQKQSHHKLQKLERLAETLKSEIRAAMGQLSDKITELCKLEKGAWGTLDDVEVNVNSMIEEVEKATEKQAKVEVLTVTSHEH